MDRILIKDKEFNTLVAISEEEQQRGLMFKSWPPPIMTFDFKKADYHKFWMKDTISPLDIIFCKRDKIIDIYKGQPLSLTFIGPDDKTDMVIEMPLGTAEKYGIKKGDSVNLKYSLNTLAKRFKG